MEPSAIGTVPQYLIGTASWTDPTLVKSDTFYPSTLRTAEQRLRFYASQFNTVEVDASYYTLLSEKNSQLWAERTPPGFIFDVKAFALLTQHATEVARLPLNLKAMLTQQERAQRRLERPSQEVLETAFQMFHSSLTPLRAAGKLGMLVFQFPPYFICRPANFAYLESLQARLPGDSIAIEFRHLSWVAEGRQRRESLEFLRSNRLCYVSVDEPQLPGTLPPLLETTAPEVYIRFHGRNREAWHARRLTVAERYKYLYSERELAEWAERIRGLGGISRAHVIFNNCYRNFGVMNATTMRAMLERSR
jgi:uncharacterized protein YecE (DUF72 family)